MKGKMLSLALVIIAFAALSSISFGILFINNRPLTQGSPSETTIQQSWSELRLRMRPQDFVSISRYPAGVSTLSVLGEETPIDTTWRLIVYGLVQNPLNLTLGEIAEMPKNTAYATLLCIDSLVPISSGNWTGVKLAYLLQEAGVNQTAVKVAFYSTDGYSTDLKVQDALKDDVIVAYRFNGQPLEEGLRLVVPGRYGYKWISFLGGIELVDYDFQGKWERYGYPD